MEYGVWKGLVDCFVRMFVERNRRLLEGEEDGTVSVLVKKWVGVPFSFLFFVVYCTLLSKCILRIVGAHDCRL